MNYLVGDIGNTFIKLSILNEKFLIRKTYNFKTRKIKNLLKKNFIKKFTNQSLYRKILISSVVPKALTLIKKILKKEALTYLN